MELKISLLSIVYRVLTEKFRDNLPIQISKKPLEEQKAVKKAKAKIHMLLENILKEYSNLEDYSLYSVVIYSREYIVGKIKVSPDGSEVIKIVYKNNRNNKLETLYFAFLYEHKNGKTFSKKARSQVITYSITGLYKLLRKHYNTAAYTFYINSEGKYINGFTSTRRLGNLLELEIFWPPKKKECVYFVSYNHISNILKKLGTTGKSIRKGLKREFKSLYDLC